MKIAITADVHLSNDEKGKPRANALRYVIKKCKENKVDHLVIAGDLFDNNRINASTLEEIVKSQMPFGFMITIIPGNHDFQLNNDLFQDDLPIKVLEQSEINETDFGIPVLFVPFGLERRMGVELAKFKEQLRPNRFLLVSHCDLPEQVTVRNNYEEGYYMPLFKRTLTEFSPKRVFLGHIHKQSAIGIVQYPGSPFGLDITESGQRYFISYNTETDVTDLIPIDTDVVNFNESFTLVPGEFENRDIAQHVATLKSKYDELSNQNARLNIRVRFSGYSTERGKVASSYKAALSSAFSNLEDVDLITDELSAFTDRSLAQTAILIKQRIESLDLHPNDPDLMPDADQILRESMNILFGGKK